MELPASSRPPERRGNEMMSPTLPLPPPKDAESLARFVEWVASVPRDRVGDVREAIRSIRARSPLADLLHEQLFSLPCTDIGQHLMLLSITGELADPSSLDALERFVWLSDQEVYGEAADRPLGPCDFGPGGVLQARSAEMLVWVAQGEHIDRMIRILQEHPTDHVRVALIDAFLFQRDDSSEAVALLQDVIRDEDRWALGLPRRAEGFDAEDFDRRVAEHEAAHGETPPLPERREGDTNVH